MSEHDQKPEFFSAHHEHALRNNTLLLGSTAVAAAASIHEAPQLFDLTFVGVCLIAVPAIGRMIEHRRAVPNTDL
jgi:hypothetical protein